MKRILSPLCPGVSRAGLPLAAVVFMLALFVPCAFAASPCCAIKSVDLKTGSVTAVETATGRTFTFQVSNRSLLNSLKIGQGIYANFATKQVSVDGRIACCSITESGSAPAGALVTKGAQTGSPLATTPPQQRLPREPVPPCCVIQSIDPKSGIVRAWERTTRRNFTFRSKSPDPALLSSLKVGQGVYANFASKQVSLDGTTVCCVIVELAVSPSGKKPAFTAIPSASSPPLTIHDHTLIMQAVVQNRAWLLQRLSHHNWQGATSRQLAIGAMLYFLKLNSVPETTKERIRVAIQMLRSVRWKPSSGSQAFTLRRSAIRLRTSLRSAKSASSTLRMLSALQQEYRNQPQYVSALDASKQLVSDGASTIYSPEWLSRNLQHGPSTSKAPQDYELSCSEDDIGSDCFTGGGGSPFPGECDPSDPVCSGPSNCSEGISLDCPVTCPDATNPACSVPPPATCPDPNNPACNECSDASNPACSNQPPLVCQNSDCSQIATACDPNTNPECSQPTGAGCPWCDEVLNADVEDCVATAGVVALVLAVIPPVELAHAPAIPEECAIGGAAGSIKQVVLGK